jgi:hypothetical protein
VESYFSLEDVDRDRIVLAALIFSEGGGQKKGMWMTGFCRDFVWVVLYAMVVMGQWFCINVSE